MTKEEKIKEAYGKYYERIKLHIDSNGWVDTQTFSCARIGIEFEQYKKRSNTYLGFYNRPKTLQGIENNNGWIKIESEDDLPIENIECFYILEIPERYSNAGKQIDVGSFKFGKNIMSQQENYFTADNFFYHRFPFVTHYQPIQKPKPPIY